jgi:hypothetical protein
VAFYFRSGVSPKNKQHTFCTCECEKIYGHLSLDLIYFKYATYVQLCTYNKQQIFSASLRPPLGVNFDPLEWNGPLGVKFLVKSTPIDENPLFALLYLGVTRFAPKGHSSSPEANSC